MWSVSEPYANLVVKTSYKSTKLAKNAPLLQSSSVYQATHPHFRRNANQAKISKAFMECSDGI